MTSVSFPNWWSRPLSESFNGELGQREYLTLAGKGQGLGPGREREEKKKKLNFSFLTNRKLERLFGDG